MTQNHAQHGHNHDHNNHAGNNHAHAPNNYGTAFAVGIALNVAYVIAEAGFGFMTNSVALIADAGHNLSDVLGLVVAWVAIILSKRAPTARFTYGLRGTSILAAMFNAIFLLVAIGALSWEAIQRIFDPAPVPGLTISLVAGIGILVNGGTAYLFASGSKDDLNIKGAYLHMAADAVVSLGVVIAGLLITWTGWNWLDPVTSLAINAVILWGTWGLLRDSAAMSVNAVPAKIDPVAVRDFLNGRPGVREVHDLHIWPMGTTEIALTCHLLMPSGHPGDQFLNELCRQLKHGFGIEHATIQIETDATGQCPLAPEHVI